MLPEWFSSFLTWVSGGASGETTYFITRWVFLRFLGIIYLIAFLSIWVQIKGLVGSQGILPVEDYLSAVRSAYGGARFHLVPTVFWLSASDAALSVVCGLGVFFSVLVICNLSPALSLALLWVLYLSILSVGQDFLSFQWDILLLEVGFLAIFLAPLNIIPGFQRETPVPAPALALLWFLLFRLMFESGAVKLTSGDPTWSDLTALNYHYFTQPLPTWTSFYAHYLPSWFQKLSMLSMYVAELGLPFLMLVPGPSRMVAATGMILLQLLIMGTGNYNFFNLLTISLALLLFNDAFFHAVLPERLLALIGNFPVGGVLPQFFTSFTLIVATTVLLIGGWQLLRTLGLRVPAPAPLRVLIAAVSPFHSINSYGLFRVMTIRRPEIIVEGSNDGTKWEPYAFRWKPGDLRQRPRFAEPHQPRLDWQMWFAALSTYDRTPWFQNFLVRLLQGSPDVLRLLARNPFPEAPPHMIRASLYDYEFETPEGHRRAGNWWRRMRHGLYAPPLALRTQ